jgi:hypothetical protein
VLRNFTDKVDPFPVNPTPVSVRCVPPEMEPLDVEIESRRNPASKAIIEPPLLSTAAYPIAPNVIKTGTSDCGRGNGDVRSNRHVTVALEPLRIEICVTLHGREPINTEILAGSNPSILDTEMTT